MEADPSPARKKEKRSKARDDPARVDAGEIGLTQSPVAEVVDQRLVKSPPGPSGLGNFPLPSSSFDALLQQQQKQLRAMHEVCATGSPRVSSFLGQIG